jgi:hypothetical protein
LRGSVHGGSLGRWFEELCRIRHPQLREVVTSNGKNYRMRSGALPREGGVYVFWWTSPLSVFSSKQFNPAVNLHGPGGRSVRLRVDREWLGLDADLPIPVYVGKNAQNISGRVGQHLLLGTPSKVLPAELGQSRHKPPTTSCQLRAGIEHFFPSVNEPVPFLLDNIGLSYVRLDGDGHGANRFYVEDLAIGLMRPPINVDVER